MSKRSELRRLPNRRNGRSWIDRSAGGISRSSGGPSIGRCASPPGRATVRDLCLRLPLLRAGDGACALSQFFPYNSLDFFFQVRPDYERPPRAVSSQDIIRLHVFKTRTRFRRELFKECWHVG